MTTPTQAPTPAPATEPPPAAHPAVTVASPSSCAAPFVVPPPYPDAWIDDAAAAPAIDMGPWPTRPMDGPVATRELAAPGCARRERLPAAPPFDEIERCTTADVTRPPGPDNLPEHRLVVHTAAGWWSRELARATWPHREVRAEPPQLANVRDLASGDRLGDGGAEITAIAEEGPPGGSVTRTVFVCGMGPSAVPACVDVRVAANGPFHGEGALLYRLELTCDGTLALAGWEGGTQPKLVHGRGHLTFP